MKQSQKWNVLLLLILSIIMILIGGIFYIVNVQKSLWNKSVTDILEVTAQGRHALDTFIEKDMEMMHWLTAELAAVNSSDSVAIQKKMEFSDVSDAAFICVDLDEGIIYTELLDEGWALEDEQLELFRSLEGKGVRNPYLAGRTGVWTIGYYECFRFADGAKGLVQKTQPLDEIAERFSLSFYEDTGFSYVVNREGKILIRSHHRNSNRTFQNLFDIIDLQGNDTEEISSFRTALQEGKKGAARFSYQGEEYVFCYVPMENVKDWYVVSIIPNRVILEQTNSIIYNSRLFLALIIISILILTAFFILYRNSTRRILLAEEEARRAAESANLAKSRFLSNMSHDIRTPMNAVIGMTKLAYDHAEEPDKVRRYLKDIAWSGQLLRGLIDDILDLSKIESGRMTLNNRNASLEDSVSNLVNIIVPLAQKKKQTFEIRLHQVNQEMLCFDTVRLNQIMINILTNAVKFTPEGGVITVDLTESPSPKENCIHFTFRVADTGLGMQPEFLEHIFDTFAREQDNRINQIEGSGLGMAITKMIVDMMGGTIQVESEPDKGSAFTVELDLALPLETPVKQVPLPPVRVLVADENHAVCSLAEGTLRELGVDADVEENGQNIVKKVLAAHEAGRGYDLLLLGWEIDGLNQMQTVRTIRQQIGEGELAVVVFSYDGRGIEVQAREAGVNGFIQKPLFKSTFYRCIQRYVLHEESGSKQSVDGSELMNRRILVAEDNPINQEIVQELLQGMGARVEVADNGLACAERFAQSEPGTFDLILMDIQMPIMNGYEATRKIRSMDRSDAASIPIFAMTADAFTEDIEAAKQAGMNAHMSKPLDISFMMCEMRKYLKPNGSENKV